MGDVGRLVGSECGEVWLGMGGRDGIQNFRVILEGLLEIVRDCEDSGDLMLDGV